MNSIRCMCAALALMLTGTRACSPFEYYRLDTNNTFLRWSWRPASLPIPIVLNDQPIGQLLNVAPNSQLEEAINGAMAAWELPPLGFRLNGAVKTTDLAWDGVNLVTFANTPKNRDFAGTLLARSLIHGVFSSSRWRIVDADVVMGPRTPWATNGRKSAYDVQEILTHELGHALGMDHSVMCSATMHPYSVFGETTMRTPETDDLAGVRALYGIDPGPEFGSITGTIVITDDKPVFGAHVAAVDEQGIVRVGRMTSWHGAFTIPSLPAGEYRVYAEPLDGPVTPSDLYAGAYADAKHPVLREFQTAFAGGNANPTVVTVSPGQATPLAPIRVKATKPTLNPTDWGWKTSENALWREDAVQVRSGLRVIVRAFGTGLGTVSFGGVSVSGSSVSIDSSGIYWDRSSSINQWIIFPANVDFRARPGPRSIYLSVGEETAVLSGAIEVIP